MDIQTNTTHTAMLLYELQQLLIQIKTCNGSKDGESQLSVELLSQHGLQLLHYALFAIESQQTTLPLTTVSAGAAMHEVVAELQPLAATYGATILFDASPYLEPVYAHKTTLKGSIYALLAGVITSSTNAVAPTFTIAVQQTKPREQRIGVYSDTTPLSVGMVKKRQLSRVSRMDTAGMSHKSGLGFAVSQLLAHKLETSFLSFEHREVPGIGFYLPESAQLQLV